MADNEDLLYETKKLLTELNRENAEMKERNRLLAAKVRESEDAAIDARRAEKDLERDSKQLNFSLMQQMQAKTDEAKAAAAKEAYATARAHELQRQLDMLQEAHAELDARHKVAREQVKLMESKMETARNAAERLEAELEHLKGNSAAAMSVERERAAAESKHYHLSSAQLKERLSIADRRIAELEARLDDAHASEADADRRHSIECSRLKAAAQRTLESEAEAAYLHDQMLSIADRVHSEYDGYVEMLSGVIRQLVVNDSAVSGAMNLITDQRAALDALRESDRTLHLVLRKSMEEMDAATSECKGELVADKRELQALRVEARVAHQRVSDCERRRDQLEKDLDVCSAKLAAAESKCAEETRAAERDRQELERCGVSVSHLKSQLQDHRDAAYKLEERLSLAERKASQERAELSSKISDAEAASRHAAAETRRREALLASEIQRLHDDNVALREQLNQHAVALASEVQRLQNGASRTSDSVRRTSLHRDLPSMSVLKLEPTPTTVHVQEQTFTRSPSPQHPQTAAAALAQRILASVKISSADPH